MGLDQYAHLRGVEYDFDKYRNDKSCTENNQFYWRKHARLQVFMDKEHKQQNKNRKLDGDLQYLGFNGDTDIPYVLVTNEVLDNLDHTIKKDYWNNFCSDGFFWGQQFQEESMKEYREQDLEFVAWARQQIKDGKEVIYDCSW